jgi:elongation factor G
MADDVKRIRNLGLVGQGGAGKTTTADAMLLVGGATNRLGSVADGSSNFDFEPEEVKHQVSFFAALHHVDWDKHEVTLLDTPGYMNFLQDTLNCMQVCSGLVFVLSPGPGEIKVEAERLWARADELELPRLAFVSKLDKDRADFQAAVDELSKVLGARPVVLQIPMGSGDSFRGVIDLQRMKALVTNADGKVKEEGIPGDLKAAADAARERMIEAAAEATDDMTERYLENGTLTADELTQALREGTAACRFVPVLCGAAGSTAGIHALLDAVVQFLPSPAERPAVAGVDPKLEEPIERHPDPESAFSGLVFKTIVDPFAGRLSVFQVRSGTVKADSTVFNANKDGKEHLGHLFRLQGKKQQQVDQALAGEIVAVAKLKNTSSGDTLTDEKAPILYPGLELLPSVMSFALEPKSKGDEEKASQALHKMMEEDLALRVQRDPQTHELILSGVGQSHIEVVVERLKRKYGVEVDLKTPKVPYKETIKGKAKSQGKLKKQTGGRGQYGDTWIEIEPLPRGGGFEFVNAIKGGVVPGQYIPAVEKGIREAMHEGFLAGCEMVDIKATLYDGSYHDVDSSEMAFKIAASVGFKSCVAQAKPILLEPIMQIEVVVPDDCMGDVIGDLNSRRGRVLGVDAKPSGQVIRAQVPMAEVLKYAPDLRSMTGGRGSFSLEFQSYEELPAHLVDKVVREAEAAKAAKS